MIDYQKMILFLLVSLLFAPLLNAEENQEIFPKVTNVVSEKEKNKVIKNPEELLIKKTQGWSRGTYLKFTNIQFKNQEIKKAELVLECTKLSSSAVSKVQLTIGQLNNDWDPNQINWNHSPVPNGTIGQQDNIQPGPVKVIITDFIKRMKKANKTGFSLLLAELQPSNRLASFAGINSDKKPRIIITYK